MSSKYQTQLVQFARRALSATATATKPQPANDSDERVRSNLLAERMGIQQLPAPVEREGNTVVFNAFFDSKKREKP